MALSGSKSTQVTAWDTLKFSWERLSYSVAENASIIDWQLELVSGSSGAISSSVNKNCVVTVNGNTRTEQVSVSIGNNFSKILVYGRETIPHNADGTKTFSFNYSVNFDITFSSQYIGTISGSGTGTLDTIPREAKITSAPNFTNLENPTITYSNPAGGSVTALQACISIVGGSGGDDVPYRDIPVNGTSYTFELTTAERNTLINAVTYGNSVLVRFYVLTNIGGTLYRSYITKTFTIEGANPVIDSIVAQDTSTLTMQLTGNVEYWVKGFSNVYYSVRATAQNGASISSYSVVCGSDQKSTSSGTFEDVTDGSIKVTVTDSRGLSTTQTISPTKWIDYNGLTCTVTEAKLDIDGNLKFTATGVYFMGSFGSRSNNLRVYYRYRPISESEYSDWIELPMVAATNSYTTSSTITELNYREDYALQLYAQDNLQTVYSDQYLIHKAMPVYEWDNTDFMFNVPAFAPSFTTYTPDGYCSSYPDNTVRSVMRVDQDNSTLYIGSGAKTDDIGQTLIEGASVSIESNKTVFVDAPSGIYLNNSLLADYVVSYSEIGNWFYKKYNSGIVELWGWCEATYGASYYLSTYQSFPVTLTKWISATGTVNNFGGNLSAYLSVNAKIECFTYGCNVWVQNSNNSFQSGDVAEVSIHVIGRWK